MKLNILSLQVGEDGCSGYRIRKPLHGLGKYTDHNYHIIDSYKDSMEDIVKVLPEIDIVFMRPGAENGMFQIKNIFETKVKHKLKAKWVLDIDDNLDDVSPLSQFYKEYGLAEATYQGKKLWEDGRDGFFLDKNRERLASLQWGLKNCDMVIVTTEKLAEHAREYNDNVYVNDNSIDLDVWWKGNNKINKPLKIVWQGSPSHYEDWYEIKDGVNKILSEYDVELLMLGSNYKGIFDEENLEKVKTLPWVKFDAHSYRMMSIQADIAIIPLADTNFNHNKSSIKWYEMSAMGIPSVVANVKPYADVIQHEKTAMAYNTPEEFYEGLKKLIENKGLRKNIGNAARLWIEKNKSLEVETKKLSKRLEELARSND